MPAFGVPKKMKALLHKPETIMRDIQMDKKLRGQYEKLYRNYVMLRYYDERDSISDDYLEENMMQWLFFGSCMVRALLGEFGDGKTFFVYCLCRKLLEQFIQNPDKNFWYME